MRDKIQMTEEEFDIIMDCGFNWNESNIHIRNTIKYNLKVDGIIRKSDLEILIEEAEQKIFNAPIKTNYTSDEIMLITKAWHAVMDELNKRRDI